MSNSTEKPGALTGEDAATATAEFEARLRKTSLEARKLLANIADLATHSHGLPRKENAAYLPELHETCGLDPEPMFKLLQELQDSGFVQIEGEYPFQDVLLTGDFAHLCVIQAGHVREIVVDLKFDSLR